MAKGSGYGKTILIGDHFVLHGVPAIVAALPFETVADVERIKGDGWILEDNRNEVPGYKEKKKEQQIDSINRILEVMKIHIKKTPIKITYGGALLAGSGVGASAASCVSLARALNAEFELGLSINEINQVGWEGEFAYHGTPSGVDNTASTYRGILLYQVQDEKKSFERLQVKTPINVVLANSGVTSDTSTLSAFTAKLKEKDPGVFEKHLQTIKEQAFEIKKGLEMGDNEKVGSIMTENHKILIDMGLSHEILVYLCKMALEKGASGAKVTGGGRGGYMVALAPNKDIQESIASVMEKERYEVIRATIGEN